jgi:hypothetical protein
MTPSPEVSAMTVTVYVTMTSDQSPHTARRGPGRDHAWEVSWLPGRTLDSRTATTAMVLADLAADPGLDHGHPLWGFVESYAAELGMTASDAVAQASEPPGDLSRQQEKASRQPDREAAD